MSKRKFIQHTAKIADIPISILMQETSNFFHEVIKVAYNDSDSNMGENLFEEEDILEAIQAENADPAINMDALHEVEMIHREMRRGKYSFVRLTTE